MLYVSSVLDENTPYYIDNILGMLGLAFILMAGALVPIVVYMRRALRMANQVKSTQEIYPIVEFLRESHKMWKYATSIFTVIIILAVVAAIVAAIYLLPMLKNI